MRALAVFALLLAAALFGAGARAEIAAATPAPGAVEHFVDGVVAAYRRERGIAGVTVAVVSRDGLLMLKGYGYAGVNPERPVDPLKTLFRIASISKTFTYVLAMKLVEQGKLDLDAPADQYLPDGLKFEGDGFPVPRVLDLMQHTAGFEDSALGHLFTPKPYGAMEDYLTAWRPKRVRPPGAAAVYSNYSVALLGLIIQRIENRPFEEVAENLLFRPLGMTGASFREPPDNATYGTAMSQGFKRRGGWFAPQPPFFTGQGAPAGAASATAESMARYMRMLLNGGALDGVQILKPETFRALVSPTHLNAPQSGALAHGFFRRMFGRYQSLEHDGAALFFWSSMVVWPDAGIGVFVSTNTDSGLPLTNNLARLLIEEFYPDARPAPAVANPSAAIPPDAVGPYVAERRNQSSFEGFLYRLVDLTALGRNEDGSYLLSTGDSVVRYVPEGDGVLRAVESGAKLTIQTNPDGSVMQLAGASGVSISKKLGLLDAPFVLHILTLLVMAGSVVVLVTFGFRVYYRGGAGQGVGERIVSGWQALTALIWIAAAVLLAMSALPMLEPDQAVLNYPGPTLPLARYAIWAAAGASALGVLLLWPAWTGRSWRVRRLTVTLYVLVTVALALLLWRWGAIGTQLSIAG